MLKTITASLFLLISQYTQAQTAIICGRDGITNVNCTNYAINSSISDSSHVIITATKNSDKFFATNISRHKITVLNSFGNAIIDSIDFDPVEVSANRHSDTLFAVKAGGGIFFRINGSTYSIIDSITIGGSYFLEERPNSNEVWASNYGSVAFVNTSGSLTLGTLTLGNSGLNMIDVRFSITGDTAYTATVPDGKIRRINAVTKTVIDSATFSGIANRMELSADGNRLFVSINNAMKIYIYSTSTMALVDSIVLDKNVGGIYHSPFNNEIWAVFIQDNQVNIYDDVSFAKVDSITGTMPRPVSIAFTSQSVSVENVAKSTTAVKVYPNPSEDYITIDPTDNGELNVSITNVAGQILNTVIISQKREVNISQYPSGTYFITTESRNDGSRSIFKILKL